ncbi:MAG: glycosyltransferase family 2 protein [Bacteroides sp.]|nr:glycosyltransferase family 2 protein [Roseburia sp.]MCM1345815.1 glycosyltransferase family 2 protein [Bacteroides sp.]MCM1421280.1 glycosyltransferase family 2 protein [Bacteroides sp.]
MSIFIIIVTYNAMPWLDRCIGSVYTNSHTTVVVVDNKSTDNTIERIKTEYPRCILIENKANLGFGHANNIGIHYALEHGCDYIYLLNQDAWVMPGTIEKLIDVHQHHPEYGIISPVQTDAAHNRAENFLCRYRPTLRMFTEDTLLQRTQDIYEIKFCPAAHWLLPRHIIEKVGMFSPVFLHYAEDANFIQRVKYHGYKVGFFAFAVHDRGKRVVGRTHKVFASQLQLLKHASNVCRPLWFNVLHLLLYYISVPFYLLYMYVCKYTGKEVRYYYFHIAPIGLVVRELRQNKKKNRI